VPVEHRRTLRRAAQWFAAVLGAATLSQLALVLLLVANPRCSPTPARKSRLFEITTQDAVVLRGEMVGDPGTNPVVVFAHGYRRNRRDVDAIVPSLVSAGYCVVSFDFRSSGASNGWWTTGGASEWVDVDTVVRYLRDTHHVAPERIAIVGFSMGAVATALAAPHLPHLGAVVLIAPYASLEGALDVRTRRWAHVGARPWLSPALFLCKHWFGIDPDSVNPEATIGAFGETPLLLLAGEDDWRAPPDVVHRLYERAGRGRALGLIPDLDHEKLQSFPEPVRERVVGFLGRAMK
jgi:uncharacterized protein